jgi:hypothetical protein
MRLTPVLLMASLLPALPAWGATCVSNGYSSQYSESQIDGALTGNSVDADNPTSGENWKEDHCTGGDLFKVGAGTPGDPYRKVGEYQISSDGSDTISYTYTGLSPYTFTVWSNGTGLWWELGGDAKAIDADAVGSPAAAGTCNP